MAQEPSQKNEICSYAFFLNHARLEAEYDDLYPPMSSIIRYGVPGDYHYENIEDPSLDSQFLCLSDENEEYYSTWRNHTLAPSADSLNPFVAWSRSSNSQINGFDPKLYSNQIYWILQKEEEKSLSANSHRSSQDSEWSDNMIAITIFSTLIVGAYATRSSWSNTPQRNNSRSDHDNQLITIDYNGHVYHSPSARCHSINSNRDDDTKLLRTSSLSKQKSSEPSFSHRFPNITYEGQSHSEQDDSSPLTSGESIHLALQDPHELPTSTQSTYGSPISGIQYYDCRSSSPRSTGLTSHSSIGRFSFVQYDGDPLNHNPHSSSNPHLEKKSEGFRGIYYPCPWEQRTDQHCQSSSEDDSSSGSDHEDEDVMESDSDSIMHEPFPVGMSPAPDNPRNEK